MKSKSETEELIEVFSKYITLKNGKKIYAWEKGLKSFHFFVKKKNKD